MDSKCLQKIKMRIKKYGFNKQNKKSLILTFIWDFLRNALTLNILHPNHELPLIFALYLPLYFDKNAPFLAPYFLVNAPFWNVAAMVWDTLADKALSIGHDSLPYRSCWSKGEKQARQARSISLLCLACIRFYQGVRLIESWLIRPLKDYVLFFTPFYLFLPEWAGINALGSH